MIGLLENELLGFLPGFDNLETGFNRMVNKALRVAPGMLCDLQQNDECFLIQSISMERIKKARC